MKTIRASEICSYLFCQRAWWYQLHGYETENMAEMAGGIELHEGHARAVLATSCLKARAFALLILAVLALTAWLVGEIL
jgi:CRISPR/Cas system-associated exonuclease Cas4 (RecB family)